MQENSPLQYVFVTKLQCPNVQKERAGLAGRQVMGTRLVSAMRVSQIVKWNPFVRGGEFTAQSRKRQRIQKEQ